MAKKKQEPEGLEGLPAWMGTYGDMVTLLLCFFVLMFASSSTDVGKYQQIAQSFNPNLVITQNSSGSEGINELMGSGIMVMPSFENNIMEMETQQEKMEDELNEMASDFATYFAENNLNDDVAVEVEDNYVNITFKDGILFDSGAAMLTPGARQILADISSELSQYPDSQIMVVGHTDNIPISTAQFPSNYYLSAARAISVLEFLVNTQGINPKQISAEGKGEFDPIAPNDTPENRAKNRRVEIKITSQYDNQ